MKLFGLSISRCDEYSNAFRHLTTNWYPEYMKPKGKANARKRQAYKDRWVNFRAFTTADGVLQLQHNRCVWIRLNSLLLYSFRKIRYTVRTCFAACTSSFYAWNFNYFVTIALYTHATIHAPRIFAIHICYSYNIHIELHTVTLFTTPLIRHSLYYTNVRHTCCAACVLDFLPFIQYSVSRGKGFQFLLHR